MDNPREERAKDLSHEAADELATRRREKEPEWPHHDDNDDDDDDKVQRSVIESLKEGTKSFLTVVRPTLAHAKEATTGKPSESTEYGARETVEEDSPWEAIRQGLGRAADKEEVAKQRFVDNVGEGEENIGGDETRRKMEEVKPRNEGKDEEEVREAQEEVDKEADIGIAAKGNVLSSMGTLLGSLKEKLIMPREKVERVRREKGNGRTWEETGQP